MRDRVVGRGSTSTTSLVDTHHVIGSFRGKDIRVEKFTKPSQLLTVLIGPNLLKRAMIVTSVHLSMVAFQSIHLRGTRARLVSIVMR